MTFTISSISLCPGTGHVTISGTVGGQAVTRVFNKSELQLDSTDIESAVIARMRSAAKEAGAVTLQQIKTAIEGKTFQI